MPRYLFLFIGCVTTLFISNNIQINGFSLVSVEFKQIIN